MAEEAQHETRLRRIVVELATFARLGEHRWSLSGDQLPAIESLSTVEHKQSEQSMSRRAAVCSVIDDAREGLNDVHDDLDEKWKEAARKHLGWYDEKLPRLVKREEEAAQCLAMSLSQYRLKPKEQQKHGHKGRKFMGKTFDSWREVTLVLVAEALIRQAGSNPNEVVEASEAKSERNDGDGDDGDNQLTVDRFNPSSAYKKRKAAPGDFTKSFFHRQTTYDFIDDLADLAKDHPVTIYVGRSFASDITAPMTDQLMASSLERWLQEDEEQDDDIDRRLTEPEREEIIDALRDAYPASYLGSMARETARKLNKNDADPNGDSDFKKYISNGITQGRDPGEFLAHSIGAIAFAFREYSDQSIQVITTNYHDQIATRQGKVRDYFPFLSDCYFPPAVKRDGKEVPLYNLNGLISESDPSAEHGGLVVGEADRFVQYDRDSEPLDDLADSRSALLGQALERSACIFVGSSLSTADTLAKLAATKYKRPRYAIVQSPELGLVDREQRSRAVNLAAQRFLHLGVVPIFIDFSHQAPQLLVEVALRLKLDEKAYKRENYEKRLDTWWREGRKNFGFGRGRNAKGTKRYKELSDIQQVWVDELDKARRRIAKKYLQIPAQRTGGDEPEKLQMDVWLREPEARRLRLWASSDGIFLDASTAPWCYIHRDVDTGSAARAAVQKAFRSGKTVGESVDQPSAGIWAYQMCMPLVMNSDTTHYLPVGVARILSSRGMIEDANEDEKPDGKLAETASSADKLQDLSEYVNGVVNELLNRDSTLYKNV